MKLCSLCVKVRLVEQPECGAEELTNPEERGKEGGRDGQKSCCDFTVVSQSSVTKVLRGRFTLKRVSVSASNKAFQDSER